MLWLKFGPCSKATTLLSKVLSLCSKSLCFVLYINLYIPPRKLLESSPFMVDAPDRGTSMSALKISPVDSPFTIFNLHRWWLFAAAAAVFSFQARGDFGGYLVWLSHPPPVLIPAHAMKQNTGDMSASKALSGSQKHLPKYLHLLLLFIHRQCGALLLVFGGASAFPIYSSSRDAKKNWMSSTLSLHICIGG